MSIPLSVVEVTGFEPATSSSRTKRATKLRHTSKNSPDISGPMAAELGFEPRHTESESAVLPLHNSALHFNYYNQKFGIVNRLSEYYFFIIRISSPMNSSLSAEPSNREAKRCE